MWRQLFSLFVIFLQVSSDNEDFRIIGGHEAKPGEFPYMVLLEQNGEVFCGASIINDEWILSAYHCFSSDHEYLNFTVVTGTVNLKSGGKRYLVKNVVPHPYSDIALVQLRNKISFDSSTSKINLPTEDTPNGTKVILTGWGLIAYKPSAMSTDTLQALSLVTITNQECQKIYKLNNITEQIKDELICTLMTKGKGMCYADSGSPLVDPSLNTQVGLVLGAIPCANGDVPDRTLRIYKFLDWINDEMSPC